MKISAVSHRKALILALVGIVGGLAISVASFAATSSSASLSIAASSGLSGEFGFVLSQDAPATTTWTSDATTTVTVGSVTNFAVGDHILIDEDSGLDEVAISVPGGVADNGERHDQAEKQSDDPDKRHQGDQPGP